MDLNLPKYILKRMFPPGQSMFLVRKGDAETPNYVMFQAINIMMPLEFPISGLEGFKLEDVGTYGKIFIDGNELAITPERFANDVSMWFKGLCMDYDYLQRMLKGETEQMFIPIGDKVSVLFRIQDGIEYLRNLGSHTFSIHVKYSGFEFKVEIPLDLTEENSNLEFDPSLT